jgi:hypothetical protein
MKEAHLRASLRSVIHEEITHHPQLVSRRTGVCGSMESRHRTVETYFDHCVIVVGGGSSWVKMGCCVAQIQEEQDPDQVR